VSMVTRRTFGRRRSPHPASTPIASAIDANGISLLRTPHTSFLPRMRHMTLAHALRRYLAVLVTLAVASTAAALPIELNDANGTRYKITRRKRPSRSR